LKNRLYIKNFKKFQISSTIEIMTEPLLLLNQRIKEGKQALFEKEFDSAIKAFEEATIIGKNISPRLDNIVGISFGNIALALAHQGKRDLVLDNVLRAADHLTTITEKPLVYTSILHGLGLDLQKFNLHDSSIILLKIALDLARKNTPEHDTRFISILTRQLAFSYSKIDNLYSSAKLFRISADLEEQATTAVDLYKNSAYLYYKDGVREEARNILETAFDKSGIIGDTDNQTEIARFQVTISYEIMKKFASHGLSQRAVAYSEICINKSRYLKDHVSATKILYEAALILQSIGKFWQRNTFLKQIIIEDTSLETERIRQRAILHLAVHFLEIENFSEAFFYLEQLSLERITEINPQLSQKLMEVSKVLEKSQRRGLIQTDLRFSRSDLDLPVDQLLEDDELITFSTPERPSSLELEELSVNLNTSQITEKLKPPSVASLQALFDTEISVIAEPEQVEETAQEIDLIQSDLSLIEEEIEVQPITESQIDGVFSAHQESTNSHLPSSSEIFEMISPSSQSRHTDSDIMNEPQSNIRYEVGRRLQKAGWSINLNFSTDIRQGGEPDILAEKGLIRRRKKLIFFAEHVPDAEICAFLLQSNPESGDRIIYLLDGNPREADVSSHVKVINRIDQLF
jgi:tetratricopeptide (TPR) repeat protein